MMIKPLLIFAGTISVLLGVIGIFVPVLPATPFFLVTAGLYIRSSPVLYNRLLNSKLTGSYFKDKKGKFNTVFLIGALAVMWLMILLISGFVIKDLLTFILLLGIGITGSIFKLKMIHKIHKNQII